jgi:hypothetical protein
MLTLLPALRLQLIAISAPLMLSAVLLSIQRLSAFCAGVTSAFQFRSPRLSPLVFKMHHTLTSFVFPPAVFITRGLSTLLIEWRYDGDYTRFALMPTAPYLFCVSLVGPAASVIPINLMFSFARSSLRCK